MNKSTRLTLSALIAFLFYAAWAYLANMGAVSDALTLYRVALVQGLTSGTITLVFTIVTASEYHYWREYTQCHTESLDYCGAFYIF